MATFVKTKHGWQAQVARRVDGKTVRKAKTFKNKREAQVWAREYEVEISKGVDSDDTLEEVFDRYAEERSRAKKGNRWEFIRLKKFANDTVRGQRFGDYKLKDVTVADLDAWRQQSLTRISEQTGKPLKPSSVRREMNLLKHVFVTATEEWELLKANPMAPVKRPASSKRRKRRVYPDEIDKLFEALDLADEPWVSNKQITGAAFLFAIETAMRSGEILGIENRRVHGSVVHLPETKNDHSRDVPMTDRAMEILEAVRNGNSDPEARPFNISAADRDARFRAAVAVTGIENLQFRDSRHEGITRLAKRFEILDLARVTGHKNLNELLTYYEASGEELAERLNSATSREDTQ